MREHQGRIWAENPPNGGARFVVELPITTPRPSGEHATTAPVTPLGNDSLRVLVVDDEASVRVSLQRYLAAKGQEVEATASGEDALNRLKP